MIPVASEEQLLLVELVRSVSAMRTETVIQTVKEVLKQPPAIAKDKVSFYYSLLKIRNFSGFMFLFFPLQSWSVNIKIKNLTNVSVHIRAWWYGHFGYCQYQYWEWNVTADNQYNDWIFFVALCTPKSLRKHWAEQGSFI